MPLFDVFWSMLMFFLFIAWIWVVISVIADVFRSDDLGGFAKAAWAILIVLVPWLGVLGYLLARGSGMQERTLAEAARREERAKSYIRDAAGGISTADEISKLAALKDAGHLTDEEFATQKAAVLAG